MSLTSQVLSLLSDVFFFTGFPLSGIYNMPAEVERLIFTTLSYQSYFKFKAQCCFHLEIFFCTSHLQDLYKPCYAKTSPISPVYCKGVWLAWRRLHHPTTQAPAGGQSLLPMDSKAVGREKGRLGGSGGRNQVFMPQKSFFWDTQLAWLLAVSLFWMGLMAKWTSILIKSWLHLKIYINISRYVLIMV